MKKWIRPSAIIDEFEANEYVAACGDTGWNFICDAGIPGHNYNVWIDANNNGKLDQSDVNLMDGKLHSEYLNHIRQHYWTPVKGDVDISSKNEDHMLYPGFIQDSMDNSVEPVQVWTKGHTEIHCSSDVQPWSEDRS